MKREAGISPKNKGNPATLYGYTCYGSVTANVGLCRVTGSE